MPAHMWPKSGQLPRHPSPPFTRKSFLQDTFSTPHPCLPVQLHPLHPSALRGCPRPRQSSGPLLRGLVDPPCPSGWHFPDCRALRRVVRPSQRLHQSRDPILFPEAQCRGHEETGGMAGWARHRPWGKMRKEGERRPVRLRVRGVGSAFNSRRVRPFLVCRRRGGPAGCAEEALCPGDQTWKRSRAGGRENLREAFGMVWARNRERTSSSRKEGASKPEPGAEGASTRRLKGSRAVLGSAALGGARKGGWGRVWGPGEVAVCAREPLRNTT